MEAATREPSIPDADSPPSRPWVFEPKTPDLEITQATGDDDTPTEPGYGHGV